MSSKILWTLNVEITVWNIKIIMPLMTQCKIALQVNPQRGGVGIQVGSLAYILLQAFQSLANTYRCWVFSAIRKVAITPAAAPFNADHSSLQN